MEQSSLVDNEVASPMEEVSCAHVLFVFAVLDILVILVVLVVLVVVKNIRVASSMSLLILISDIFCGTFIHPSGKSPAK